MNTAIARTTHTTSDRAAGVILAASAVVFLAAEAISAVGWRGPSYSYLTNWISDLGVPDASIFQGRAIDSPLSAVMNTGFILSGLLLLAGTLLLAGGLNGKSRRAIQVLAVVSAAGYLLLGLFHGSTAATADGTVALHFTGAFAAILGGNTITLLLGIHWWKQAPTRRLGQALAIVSTVGFIAVVVLGFTATTPSAPNGLVERATVYPIMLGQLLTAAHLLTTPRRTHTA